MRLLTDLQIALLAAVVIWSVWFFGPVVWREILDMLDPERERFRDVDELAERDRWQP